MDLLVIGGGPTGVAALCHAKAAGMEAIAIEEGDAPLHAVRRFADGLVLVSHPSEFQVGDIPLDCRDPEELTREEVLHYYARLINLHGLRIATGRRCVDLQPMRTSIRVHVQSRERSEQWRARNVLVTSWYQRRRLPAGLVSTTGVRVHHGLQNVAEVAGRRVVIVGSGLSGHEYLYTLMLHGHSVTLVGRGHARSWVKTPSFSRLLEATGSQVIERATHLEVDAHGLRYRDEHRRQRRVRCDAVVACLGQELRGDALAMAQRAGLLTRSDVLRLRKAEALIGQVTRGAMTPDDAQREALALRPDLWRQLFDGVRGVRIAGGVLHVGGPHAGACVSIHTSRLAIDAIGGRAAGDIAPPLAESLLAWAAGREIPIPRFTAIADLIPIAVQSWTRTTAPLLREVVDGRPIERPAPWRASYHVGRAGLHDVQQRLVALCDGTRTVRGLARELGAHHVHQRAVLCRHLYTLWTSNALTWTAAQRAGYYSTNLCSRSSSRTRSRNRSLPSAAM